MIPENLKDLLDELEGLETSREKFGFLIEIADELPKITEEEKNTENKLKGCASNAWIQIEEKDEDKEKYDDKKQIIISGDAEAQISKGMLAFLSLGLSGSTREEIRKIPEKFLEKNPVFEKLSPSRNNGVLSAITVIRSFTQQS